MPETNRRKPMLTVEGLLLWESTKRNRAKRDPFEDPLERPEWQPLFPVAQESRSLQGTEPADTMLETLKEGGV